MESYQQRGTDDDQRPYPSKAVHHPGSTASQTLSSPNDDPPSALKPTQIEGGKQWPPQGYSKWNIRIRLMVCLLIPTFLETLDYTVVATAQPHIASAFNRLDLQSWVGTSYVLTSTVFLPVFGSIADILGRHWALQISLVIFLIGSAICTGAQSMPMLLAGRGIAGIGASGLLTVVRIVLTDSGSLNEDNFMNSILVVLYAIGYSTGPVIGGALLSTSFRWIFAINLPPSFLSVFLIFFLLRPLLRPAQPSKRLLLTLPTSSTSGPHTAARETPLQKFLRVDWIGTILFIGGGILILLALSLGSSVEAKGFSAPVVIASFVVGFFLIIVFVGWEYLVSKYILAAEDEYHGQPRRFPGFLYKCPKWFRLTDPAIPLEIFKNYDVCATSFAALTGGMVLFSAFYFLAIYFSIVQAKSSTSSGVQLLYFAPGLGVGVIIALRMIAWLKQPKYPAILGSIIIPIAIGLITIALDHNSQGELSGFLALTGVGIGLTFAPLVLQARYCQPAERIAIVVSMNLFFRTAGGTIGLAQLSAVLDSKVKSYIYALASTPGALSPSQMSSLGSIFGSSLNSVETILSLPPEARQIVQDAFRRACRWSFISLLPWCCVSAILCFFLSTIPQETVSRPPGAAAADEKGEKGDPARNGEQGMAIQGTLGDDGRPEGPQQHQPQLDEGSGPEQVKPWRTVPTPRGPITLIIWPLRVAYAYVKASRQRR
ncbi:hypothetical protein M407DRAFT_222177 [Tulasnella calospora MUT 4182]|uniref:Major facilitator superfamily (MFS) profile domain-containing protein n=1 Tax=Tulasnella calospora MUT 4182 TaxID=1051891 RepID=A0A0C3PXN4_9AGAM|nr:hypothetical protein M407DRAFT_222177 [Tulasnella calospora MUT 4182]